MHSLNRDEVLRYIEERADLFDACASRNPFASSAWLLHLIRQVSGPGWRFVVPEYLGDGAESTMLLCSPRGAGGELQGVRNYYSSLCSPVCSSAADTGPHARRLVSQLRREPIVNLFPLSTRTADGLQSAFACEGWYTKRYDCFGNWYLPCSATSFDAYMKARPSALRNTWERKRRKFRNNARIEVLTQASARDLDAFQSVYANSWKKPEPYPDFVPGWARICADEGWLRLGIAWVDERPIAAQFWFVMNETAYIFKLAYDEAFSNWSAGTVLTAALMEHVLDRDRVGEVDYLTGDDAYKRSWMSHRRERVGIVACNPRTPGGLVRAGYEAAGNLRQALRRAVARTGDAPVIAGASSDTAITG